MTPPISTQLDSAGPILSYGTKKPHLLVGGVVGNAIKSTFWLQDSSKNFGFNL